MKKTRICLTGLAVAAAALLVAAMPVSAQEKDIIEKGIFAEDIDLAGLNKQQALDAVNARVEERRQTPLALVGINGERVTVTGADMGLSWSNPEIITEAVSLGKSGNIIKRYKDLKELQHDNRIYKIEYAADKNAISQILAEQCAVYNVDAVDATVVRREGEFEVTEGVIGYKVDEDTSAAQIYDFLITEWNGSEQDIQLEIVEQQPRGSYAELTGMTDILGTYTTSFTTSGASRSANVTNGCDLINGTLLYPGDEFSTYEAISPFSEANGYFLAGSYLNGQVVESLGGGICQVSTTLYNAVLRAELEVTERHNHSMIINYVEPSADAAISESAGKDFRFVNNLDSPIYIEGYTHDKHITFNLYGAETRDPAHTVEYESVVLETSVPETDTIYTNEALPAGYHSGIQSAHIGYKAELWKITKENGEQVSREHVNSSVYKKSPRSVTIGVSTPDVNIYNALMAAAATGSADQAVAAAEAVAGGQQPVIAAPAEAPAPDESPEI